MPLSPKKQDDYKNGSLILAHKAAQSFGFPVATHGSGRFSPCSRCLVGCWYRGCLSLLVITDVPTMSNMPASILTFYQTCQSRGPCVFISMRQHHHGLATLLNVATRSHTSANAFTDLLSSNTVISLCS